MKSAIGIAVGFALGFACRLLGIPSPAPPVLSGAMLVFAMTVGYVTVDHLMMARSRRTLLFNGNAGPGSRAIAPLAPGREAPATTAPPSGDADCFTGS
jgi:XapX domain-containing protein